jgi:hypothetical protein
VYSEDWRTKVGVESYKLEKCLESVERILEIPFKQGVTESKIFACYDEIYRAYDEIVYSSIRED